VQVAYVVIGEAAFRETRKQTMLQWTKESLRDIGRENWGVLFKFTDVGLGEVYDANLFAAPVWSQANATQLMQLFGG